MCGFGSYYVEFLVCVCDILACVINIWFLACVMLGFSFGYVGSLACVMWGVSLCCSCCLACVMWGFSFCYVWSLACVMCCFSLCHVRFLSCIMWGFSSCDVQFAATTPRFARCGRFASAGLASRAQHSARGVQDSEWILWHYNRTSRQPLNGTRQFGWASGPLCRPFPLG